MIHDKYASGCPVSTKVKTWLFEWKSSAILPTIWQSKSSTKAVKPLSQALK